MKPRRTPHSNVVLDLPGGNEDNSLWAERTTDEDMRPLFISTWELTPKEKQQILRGARIELVVWGTGHPLVALRVELR